MLKKPSKAMNDCFRLTNLAVMPGWFMLIFAPRSSWTQRFLDDDRLFIGLGAVYATMLARAMGESPEGAEALVNPTLQNVQRLMSSGSYAGTFAGWTHYLAFDLFVGREILRDAQRKDIPHVLVVPALVLTLASGPFGLLFYRLMARLRGSK